MKYPLLQPCPEHNRYTVMGTYMLALNRIGIAISEGFETDGASIPRALWSVVGSPFDPRFMTAALGHDFMYQHHKILRLQRSEVDALFKETLIRDGVGKVKAFRFWLAVRLFGWWYWRKCAT